MEKGIILTLLTASTMIILDAYNAYESFFLFLLSGSIPGTSYVVSASTMLGLTTASMMIVIILFLGSLFHADKWIRSIFFRQKTRSS